MCWVRRAVVLTKTFLTERFFWCAWVPLREVIGCDKLIAQSTRLGGSVNSLTRAVLAISASALAMIVVGFFVSNSFVMGVAGACAGLASLRYLPKRS